MKHCIGPNDYSKDDILELITLAEDIIANPKQYANACKGKQLATLFYEPSTRTRLSFTSAMLSLGGQVIGFDDAQCTSVSKGETLPDTIRVVSNYVDIIAMRHFKEGAALVASQYGSVPIINAGDGSHMHPTQTLTDLLTIHKELGRFDNLTIGLCGDLKYGRTVYSLIDAMKKYDNIHFVLIANKGLELNSEVLHDLKTYNNLTFTIKENLVDALGMLDVLYMTRVQKERFTNDSDYETSKHSFVLDAQKMTLAKEHMIVLHPLPRVDEISVEVDNDPRAAYFRQAGNGKYIRMALILKLLEGYDIASSKEKIYSVGDKQCCNTICVTQSEPVRYLSYNLDSKSHCAYCDYIIK